MEKIETFETLFCAVDENDDGVIDKEGLEKILQYLGEDNIDR